MARGPRLLLPTRDYASPRRGFLINSCNPSAAGVAADPGTSSATTMSDVGDGDAHKYKRINKITVGKSVLYLIILFIYYVG